MPDATKIFPGPPKWAMLGCEGPLGCRLIAARVVQDGVMRSDWLYRRDLRNPYDFGDLTISIIVHPPDVLIIDGPDWQACLAELQKLWTPEQGKIPAIEAP